MYGLDQLTNARQPISLAGKQYPVRQLKLREWGDVQAWLKSVAPSPVAVAIRALSEVPGVPQAVQDALFRQAQEETRRWPPKVATGPWLRALDEIEGGQAALVRAALNAAGNDVSEDEAADIAEAATGAELLDLLRVCIHGDHRVPKPAGATQPPSPTTGASGSSESARPPAGPTATSPS